MCVAGAGVGALAPEKQGDFLKNRKIWERGTQLVPGGGGWEDTVVALCSHTWFFTHGFTAGATARAAQVLSARSQLMGLLALGTASSLSCVAFPWALWCRGTAGTNGSWQLETHSQRTFRERSIEAVKDFIERGI